MVTCKCCPYGFHIYLDFVQYCEKLGKNSLTQEQRQRRINRRQRKSKILMLGFDEFDQILNIPYGNSTKSLNSSYFTCFPHEKNEFIKNIVKDMGVDFDQVLDTKKILDQEPTLQKRSTPPNPPVRRVTEIRTTLPTILKSMQQHNQNDNVILQKIEENQSKHKLIENDVEKKIPNFYKRHENIASGKKLSPIDANLMGGFIVNKFEKKQLKEINTQQFINKITNYTMKCEENIEELSSKFDGNNEFIELKRQLKSPTTKCKNGITDTSNNNVNSSKFVEMENVKNLAKPIVIKNIKNMGTMTTTPILREIGIATMDVERKSVQTQIDSEVSKPILKATIGTQTTIPTIDGRSMGTQTIAMLAKTLINRATCTTTNTEFMCTKCSNDSLLHRSNISLKNLDNLGDRNAESQKKKPMVKTVSTQSKIDTCNKSMQHSSSLSTKSTNTDPSPEQTTPKKPDNKIKHLHKSIATNTIYTKDKETITDRPTKTIDRGTISMRIEQKNVACGDPIKPHILISCADNYCDSCKDIVKNLAKTFIQMQDSNTDTRDFIQFNSEIVLPSISLPGDVETELLTEELLSNLTEISRFELIDEENEQQIAKETHIRVLPTHEMLHALNAINVILERSDTLNIKVNPDIVAQTEWFQISSTETSNSLDVKDFLDYAKTESEHLVQFLVNLKDKNGNTAMHYAISHGNYNVAEVILDAGGYDINQMNGAGYTCAMLVALTNLSNTTYLAIARRLFGLADVNIKAKNHGQTALMIAVSHGNIDMVQMLLEANANVNIQDEDGSTALMCAAEHGRIDIVKLLLAQTDCDSTIQDIDNSTALKISVEAGYRDIGILLYAHERVYGKKNIKRQ